MTLLTGTMLLTLPLVLWQKIMYTFPWVPEFDVTTGNYFFLSVWVEFPFRSVALESARFKLARCLGEVLLFIRGNECSIFPNDKACVLWDLREPIPKNIRVCLSKSISI